ncbi:MAG: DUF1501 domain-containing protein, partial [Planctomycetes bacterium]|nr:DUF1501 domain-containing protein [Planctomycetota bacterium]
MVTLDLGETEQYCDRKNRRDFLHLGVAGLASVGLPRILKARETAVPDGTKPKDTSVILIWLDGGPSHMDMYDLKPDAPEQYRGLWKPIASQVPGFEIGELLPQQAKLTNKFSIVRSVQHGAGNHFAGAHRMLTTKEMGVGGADNTPRFPSLGSIASRQIGSRNPNVPAYVSVPIASSIGLNPGYFGGQFLGKQFDPFQTSGDPNDPGFVVRDIDLQSGMTLGRLDHRRSLNCQIDAACRHFDMNRDAISVDEFKQRAFDFVTSTKARNAFSLESESVQTRDRYGRHTWGQSALMARRLVEAGVTFVTVHMGGWDHHWNLKERLETFLPQVDSS